MMKIKLNWGTGIIIVSSVFMIVIIVIVITLMNQKVDLVTDEYYDKELRYQEQIDKLNRTSIVEGSFDITYEENLLKLEFRDSTRTVSSGEIHFYRPSDSAKDFKLPVQLDKRGFQFVNTSKLERGYWKVLVNWQSDNEEYYFEKQLMIN